MIEDVVLSIEYSETKDFDKADLYVTIDGKERMIATRIGNDYVHSMKNRVELTTAERKNLLLYVLSKNCDFDTLNFLSDYFEQYRDEIGSIMMMSLKYAKEKARSNDGLLEEATTFVNQSLSDNEKLDQAKAWLALEINSNAEKYGIYIEPRIEASLYDILASLVTVNVKNFDNCNFLNTIELITEIIFSYCFRHQVKTLTYAEVLKAIKSQSKINLAGMPIVINELINKQMELTSRKR